MYVFFIPPLVLLHFKLVVINNYKLNHHNPLYWILHWVRDIDSRISGIHQKIEMAYSKFRLAYIHVSVELAEEGR